MRLSALLLRVLVGLGLVLNGPGYVSAASTIRMPHPAPAGAATLGAPHGDEASPCPEHADATSAQKPQTDESSTPHDPVQHEHGVPGCCGSAACAGSCVVHVPASVTLWASIAFPVHGDAVRPMNVAHASPALPPRIRPPIA